MFLSRLTKPCGMFFKLIDYISFLPEAWEDYLYWQTQDKKTPKRINQLLQDIIRNGYDGIGKLEPLKHEFQGFWSRRIDDVNRLVLRMDR